MRPRAGPGICAALVAFLLAHHASADQTSRPSGRVHAALPGSDGVYGRFDGDLSLSVGLGAELERSETRAALRASAHYLWTAGAYVRYADAFGSARSRATRALSFGVDLRPLFLPRFALNQEQGPPLLDLSLDSFSITGGAYFAELPGKGFGDERGFEAGLGLGVPLFGRAAGPWLEARAERRFPDRGSAAWVFSLTLSVNAITSTSATPP